MATLPDPVPVDAGVTFRVLVGDVIVTMRVSEEALQDHFGATTVPKSLVDAYRANSGAIDAKALDRYAASGGQPVILTSADF